MGERAGGSMMTRRHIYDTRLGCTRVPASTLCVCLTLGSGVMHNEPFDIQASVSLYVAA